MSQRIASVPSRLAIQAALILEREAHQLHDSYTIPDPEADPIWEDAKAKRDHDHYRTVASQLRRAVKVKS